MTVVAAAVYPPCCARLQSARGIASDGDRTRVLTRVPRQALGHRGVADAYRSTLQTLRSDGDRRRALIHLTGPR